MKSGEILKGEVIGVLGLGRTGLAVAKFVKDARKVYLLDASDKITLPKELKTSRYSLYRGKNYLSNVPQLDMLFVSPGVPYKEARRIRSVKNGKTKVLNDTELFMQLFEGTSIGVTGTNGKTTTTALIGHILKAAGENPIIAGNIGESPLNFLKTAKPDSRSVLELSSFQLELMDHMPGIAIVLNMTPDHLDRHFTFKKYLEAKRRIVEKQREGDVAVLNYDDEWVRGFEKKANGEVFYFSRREKMDNGFWLKNKWIVFGQHAQKICSLKRYKLPGAHNIENAMAAVAACFFLYVPRRHMQRALATFKAPEHRLEHVRTWHGITFINDSKATTPDSTFSALESFSKRPIVLISGGFDKGLNYDELGAATASRVKHLVANGPTGIKIVQSSVIASKGFIKRITVFKQCSMEGLVAAAVEEADPGDVILLSPASASFDMYQNYEDRGKDFKAVVNRL